MNSHEIPRNDVSDSLLRALRNTEIAVLYQDCNLSYLWAENVPQHWHHGPLDGMTDATLFPPAEAERLRLAKLCAVETGINGRVEIGLRDQDSMRWYDLWIDADVSASGTCIGIITTAVEVTEQKHREQTLRTLLREVSHRSKNLLAIIQSIATQTGRYSGTVGDFLTRFRGRLQSLSSSQDLVTSSNWRGADLKQLIAGQVARYCADPQRNIVLSGANPYLNPNAALHVGLALHELAVNSVSFGSLSSPYGQVEIAAGPEAGGAMLLTWSEAAPADAALTEKRFGSVALERVVPASLNSSASLTVEGGRLNYALHIPADSFQPEKL